MLSTPSRHPPRTRTRWPARKKAWREQGTFSRSSFRRCSTCSAGTGAALPWELTNPITPGVCSTRNRLARDRSSFTNAYPAKSGIVTVFLRSLQRWTSVSSGKKVSTPSLVSCCTTFFRNDAAFPVRTSKTPHLERLPRPVGGSGCRTWLRQLGPNEISTWFLQPVTAPRSCRRVVLLHTVRDLQSSVQLLRNRKHSVAQNRSQQSHMRSRKLLSDSHCVPPPRPMCIDCEYQSVGEMAKKNRASIRFPSWGSMD